MEGNLGVAPPLPKVKKPMNPAEVERNERRKAAFEELRKLNPKAKWTDASKLVSFRNRGNTNGERAFMESILKPAEAAGNVAALAAVANNKPVSPAVVEAQNGVINEAAGAAAAVERKFTRNNAKRSLERVMNKYKLKPSGSLIQQMLGLHRRGENNRPFLNALNQKTAAAAAKKANKTAKKAKIGKRPNNVTKVQTNSEWQQRLKQARLNVAASGLRLAGPNLLAYAGRKDRAVNLPTFMTGRPARVRKTKNNRPGPVPLELNENVVDLD